MGQAEDETFYSLERARAVLMVLAGMALQWAALHSITFLSTVFFTSAIFENEAAGSAGTWTVNSLATFLVFLALFVTSGRRPNLLGGRAVMPAMCACLAGGAAALVAGTLAVPSRVLVLVGNALIACGTTPLIVLWGETYRHLNPRNEQLLVTLGAIVLSVVIYLVEIQLPQALAAAVFTCLPLASAFCLARARRTFGSLSKTWASTARSTARKSPALLYVCIVVFSIPYDYLRSSFTLQKTIDDPSTWSQILAMAIIVMVIAALAEYAAERRRLVLVPSLVLLLLSAALIASLLHGGIAQTVAPTLLYSGYYLFLSMVYLALGPVVATTHASPTRLFSGAMLANVGGLLLGTVLADLAGLLGEQTAALVVLGITYTVFAAGLVLLNTRSYSIFRVNYYDENEYSFEYLVPLVPLGTLAPQNASGPTGDAAANPSPDPDERVRSMLDAISAQCATLARDCGLSAREREVLIELARGRTLASIAHTLVVSENTIKAHTKAIYRKLDVHTREELLTRVEKTSA